MATENVRASIMNTWFCQSLRQEKNLLKNADI
jgi:hypothetical protein